ncbi:hypothetical protein [Dyella acidiphila]|uniref:Transmembrane protein n=1 Tax=Dyella acidiphila TaxID=2775866 RepID=A0ABR9G4T9_9GAMM|nr:hypothetical protein [Dyella acidiphila]MBE1159075.1 hypothetical protein [Dyella acidiphila]
MHYDQSWMGYGMVGGLEAGAISLVAALLLYVAAHFIGRNQGWNPLQKMAIAFLVALVLTASGDLWDLFYFNYGQVQSLQYLKARLAEVHDPDNIGLRVLCEMLGAMIGAGAGWIVTGGDWKRVLRGD